MNERVFYSPDLKTDSKEIIFGHEESHHIIHVSRLKEGELVWVTNGKGIISTASIIINKKEAGAKILESKTYELSEPGIWLAFSPLKKREKNEWIIEKAAELQVGGFYFFSSTHSERIKLNFERLNKIAVSAVKQSMNPILPSMPETIVSFDRLLETDLTGYEKYIAWCGAKPGKHLSKFVKRKKTNILIVIGPEGGFSGEEIVKAENRGFIPVSLSHLRLRSETAAIYAISVLNSIKYQ